MYDTQMHLSTSILTTLLEELSFFFFVAYWFFKISSAFSIDIKSISQEEARAKTTAWALTFADLTTLLLTFFVLLLAILNDAEAHIDRLVNIILGTIEPNNTQIEAGNMNQDSFINVQDIIILINLILQ